MIDFLKEIQIDKISFWLGVLAGSLGFWVLFLLRNPMIRFWGLLKKIQSSIRSTLTTGVEERYRREIYLFAQGNHIASDLFSLDELLIEPSIMAQPVAIPDGTGEYDDVVNLTIPFLPDWPELASEYHGDTFSIDEFFSQGENVCIISKAGMGKTTVLSTLAARTALNDSLSDNLKDKLPIFFHVDDLALDNKSRNDPIWNLFAQAASSNVSAITSAQLPDLYKSAINKKNALIIIDGLDEQLTAKFTQVLDLVKQAETQLYGNPIIITASTEYIGNIRKSGYHLGMLAAWNRDQRLEFIIKWSNNLAALINKGSEKQLHEADDLLTKSWLIQHDTISTPFDLTLKTWSAFAGDVSGSSSKDMITSYLLRLLKGDSKALDHARMVALNLVLRKYQRFSLQDISHHSTKTEQPVRTANAEDGSLSDAQVSTEMGQIPKSQIGNSLIDSRIIIQRSGNHYSFIHPIITAHLAGSALNQSDLDQIASQSNWLTKRLTIQYRNMDTQLKPEILVALNEKDGPLKRQLLRKSLWARESPKGSSFRINTLQELARAVQQEQIPFNIRAKIVTSLIAINEPGVLPLFKKLTSSNSISKRKLGILGIGLIRDPGSVQLLISLLNDQPTIYRTAMLALVNISTKSAIDGVIDILLNGDENQRKAAAESLANNRKVGHPILEEGATYDDLLVRRSVLFGLIRIQEKWALDLIQKVQIEEGQWVVRNIAEQALGDIDSPDPRLPSPIPNLTEIPWLIATAAEKGIGISQESTAKRILLEALSEKDENINALALSLILRLGESNVFPSVYNHLYGPNEELSDFASNIIWQIRSTGNEIPSPIQFGFGE